MTGIASGVYENHTLGPDKHETLSKLEVWSTGNPIALNIDNNSGYVRSKASRVPAPKYPRSVLSEYFAKTPQF